MPHYVLDGRTAQPHFPGIGRYVANLAAGLIPLLSADERLTIFYHPRYPLTLPASPRVALAPVAASPFGLAQQWQMPRLLRLLRADLYHSAYIAMPYAPLTPTILTVYDLIPLLYPEHSSRQARALAGLLNRLALRAARVVLAISEATRRDYIRVLRVRPDKIVTVPLAAAFEGQGLGVGGQGSGARGLESGRKAQASGVAPHATRHAPYVLYLGSNKPHKNLVRLVEAFARVTDHAARLVIAGAWDARYPEARRRAEALGLTDRIAFLGPVAEAELATLYAGAALFVFPSLYEGFGLPVLEAMACGVPVVCSNRSSLPEVAGDAAIQVDPLDVIALAAAIGRVLGDAALADDMRQRGLRQAARFSWTETAQQTLTVYRSLIARKRIDP